MTLFRSPQLLLALAATGCGLGAGLEPLSSDSGQATPDVWVDDISPGWGPTEGGTAVTITGGGFEGEVQVLFGSASLDVTVVDAGELVVSSPATSVEQGIDVTVRSDLGSVVVDDGFVYSDDGPPETGDGGATGGDGGGGGGGGDGGGGSAAGLTSGLVEFYYEVTACPSCFGVTGQLAVGALASFHDPVAGSWTDWLPALGTCSSASASMLTTSTEDVGEWVYLEAGTTSHGLRRGTVGGRTVYEVTGLGSDDYVRNTSWDLSVSDGGPWGPFALSDLLVTTEGFDDIQPAAILNDGAQAFGAQITAGNARFTWSPASISDSFITIVDVYNQSGSTYLGRAMCHTADTGSVTVSGLGGFPTGSLLAIYMYRYQVEEAINPADGSTVQGISSFGLIGTGTLR